MTRISASINILCVICIKEQAKNASDTEIFNIVLWKVTNGRRKMLRALAIVALCLAVAVVS